jgi:3-oxoacyl-[acyl-carrier-protein] synthase III
MLFRPTKRGAVDVGITAIATAVPENKISQQEATQRAQRLFPHLASRGGLYTNTGIHTRYSCERGDWYHEHRRWEEKTAVFEKHAVALLEEVAQKATSSAGLELREIDAIVVNTTCRPKPRCAVDESSRFPDDAAYDHEAFNDFIEAIRSYLAEHSSFDRAELVPVREEGEREHYP